MDLRTVRAYISHRLKVAGATTEMFHISARDLIFEATGGVPRLVNKLCDLSMVYTFTKGNQTVTRLTVQQVLPWRAMPRANRYWSHKKRRRQRLT